MRADHGREDDDAVGDVVEENEQRVGQEEHFWDVDATDGAVVQRAFEPLRRKCVREVGGDVAEFAAERADSFGSLFSLAG